LARVDGMNNFAAFIILYQVSLQYFLDCSPETRIQEFGSHVGVQRLVSVPLMAVINGVHLGVVNRRNLMKSSRSDLKTWRTQSTWIAWMRARWKDCEVKAWKRKSHHGETTSEFVEYSLREASVRLISM
jgi:hypothetical protein